MSDRELQGDQDSGKDAPRRDRKMALAKHRREESRHVSEKLKQSLRALTR